MYTRFGPRLKLLIFEGLLQSCRTPSRPFWICTIRQSFDKLLHKISFILTYSKINLALSRNDTMKSFYSTKLFGNPIICKDIVVLTWPYHSERATRQLTHFHDHQNGIAVLPVLVQLMQYIFWVFLNDQITSSKSQYVISLSFVIRSSWIVIRSSWIVVWSQWIAIWSPWTAFRSSFKCKQGGRGGDLDPPLLQVCSTNIGWHLD